MIFLKLFKSFFIVSLIQITIFNIQPSFALHVDEEAFKLYLMKETERDNPDAQFVIGSRYLFGKGVKQDYEKQWNGTLGLLSKIIFMPSLLLGLCIIMAKE